MLCLCLTSIIEISVRVWRRVVTLYNLNIRPVRHNKLPARLPRSRAQPRPARVPARRFMITRQYFSCGAAQSRMTQHGHALNIPIHLFATCLTEIPRDTAPVDTANTRVIRS